MIEGQTYPTSILPGDSVTVFYMVGEDVHQQGGAFAHEDEDTIVITQTRGRETTARRFERFRVIYIDKPVKVSK